MRRTAVLLVLCCSLVGLAVGAGVVPSAAQSGTDACTGPVERPADAETVIAAQGLRVIGDRYEKRPATLAAYDREARPIWSHDLGSRGRFLARNVDVTSRGVLLVSQESDHSVVELLDGERRAVFAVRFGIGDGPESNVDAYDALLEDDALLVADEKRLLRYDPETDRILQTWALPDDAFVDEQSRVTGVAPADDGYLVTIAGNGTGSLLSVDEEGTRWRVDGLEAPHSPQSLGETALIAEMSADRVVELDRNGKAVWTLTGLDRPRSAERLPDGTTLVADRRTHRVIEADPEGRIVWTAFVPWEPIDATRRLDGEAPTAATLNASGTHRVGGANATYAELEACESGLRTLGTNRTQRAIAVADDGDVTPAIAVIVVLALAAGLILRMRR